VVTRQAKSRAVIEQCRRPRSVGAGWLAARAGHRERGGDVQNAAV